MLFETECDGSWEVERTVEVIKFWYGRRNKGSTWKEKGGVIICVIEKVVVGVNQCKQVMNLVCGAFVLPLERILEKLLIIWVGVKDMMEKGCKWMM